MRLVRNAGVFKSWGAGALALATLLLSFPVAQAACWFESFEDLPDGSITNQPGWESLGSGSGLYPASVSSLMPYRGRKALSLANTPTVSDRRVALYTNTAHRYLGTNDPIVRVSAWVYRGNMSQYLTIALGTGSVSHLTVGNTMSGAIYVNGITTSVSWITGRYAKLVLWFDMANGSVMLDYDGTNVLPWTSMPSWISRYDHIKIVRSTLLIPATGSIYVDDLAVETVSLYTWAWWRFDEQMGLRTEEFTGWFNVGTLTNAPPDPWCPPLWDRLTVASNAAASEKDMYYNQASFAGPKQPSTKARYNRYPTADWTLEMLFFFDRNVTNSFHFYRMEDDALSPSPGSLIWLSWEVSSGLLRAVLRNNKFSTAREYSLLAEPGAPDNRWHHLAVVKAGPKNLFTYLDYQLAGFNELGSDTEGDYSFGSNTTVILGGLGTSDPMDDRILVDEVRFSATYITEQQKFLGAGRPIIKSFGEMPTPTQAVMGVAGMPGRLSTLERSTNLTAWVTHEVKTNTHLISELTTTLPKTPGNVHFLRVK